MKWQSDISLNEAAGSEDVLEWTAIDADLQYATIKTVLQGIIIAENQRGIFKDVDRDRRTVEMLIANRIRIVNPRGIWRRVGRRAGIPGIRRLLEYPIRVNHVASCPPRR